MAPVKHHLRILAGALLCALPLVVAPCQSVWAHPSIDISASNWKFTPAKIEAHVGEPTTLRLISAEGVHGVKSDDLGIPQTTIVPGKTTEVTFTPKKAGTYKVHCSIVCGAGHDDMALTIEVK